MKPHYSSKPLSCAKYIQFKKNDHIGRDACEKGIISVVPHGLLASGSEVILLRRPPKKTQDQKNYLGQNIQLKNHNKQKKANKNLNFWLGM